MLYSTAIPSRSQYVESDIPLKERRFWTLEKRRWWNRLWVFQPRGGEKGGVWKKLGGVWKKLSMIVQRWWIFIESHIVSWCQNESSHTTVAQVPFYLLDACIPFLRTHDMTRAYHSYDVLLAQHVCAAVVSCWGSPICILLLIVVPYVYILKYGAGKGPKSWVRKDVRIGRVIDSHFIYLQYIRAGIIHFMCDLLLLYLTMLLGGNGVTCMI